jgi:hypothetical protein
MTEDDLTERDWSIIEAALRIAKDGFETIEGDSELVGDVEKTLATVKEVRS